jgi:hypothetical protein
VIPLAMGVVVGLTLGLTGAGGSIIGVPLLMVGLGWTLPQAAPVALLAVSAAALVGTVEAWQKGLVRYRAAGLMAVMGLVTAPLGIAAAHDLPTTWLSLLFAAVLCYVAVRMLLQARRSPAEASVLRSHLYGEAGYAVCRLHPESGRISWTSPCAATLAVTGALTGFISGLLGVGGGFVIVPALRRSTELTMHGAVATSLMIITLVSAGAVASTWWTHHRFPLGVALPFMAGAIGGMLLGRRLSTHIPGVILQQVFASFVLVISVGMTLHALSLA